MPALSASSVNSATVACRQPTISWLSILATSPLPGGPSTVKRAATSAISGATAARSSAWAPAITVSVPAPAAAGPPDTGASTQPQPACACRRAMKSRPRSTAMVEKSTTRCGGSITCASPCAPNITSSTASVVGRFSSTKPAP